MSVFGLDFGDESLTVAAFRNNTIDVLQNEIGKRKTRAMVSYHARQRFVADDAISHYLSNSANTVVYIKRIIGKWFSDPDVAHEQKFIPAKLVPDADGRVAIAVRHLDKDVVVTPEEVVATLLAKIKQTCVASVTDFAINDCVIAVPHYFNDTQRRAMFDAARMANLNVLRLVNDLTCVATQYGMRRTFTSDTERRVIAFYDIGVCSTDVAVVSISGADLKMLAIESDHRLGGRDFDELLVVKLAEDIKQRYKLDVWTNTRAVLKLRKECDRLKQVLSANTSAPYTIEYLMNDTDVKGVVTREEFEALIKDNFRDRLLAPLERAVKAANTSLDQLHSLELLGGGTRVPYVQSLIRAVFGREVSKTCDADESVCWGATLHCAMLVPQFKVKPYEVQEVTSFPITAEWKHDPSGPVTGTLPVCSMDESIGLYPPQAPIPSVKILTIRETALPLQLAVRYTDAANRPPTHPYIARFAITAPTDAAAKLPVEIFDPAASDLKIKLKIKVDGSGLLSVLSAQTMLDVANPALTAYNAQNAASGKKLSRVDMPVYGYYPWNLTEAGLLKAEAQYRLMVAHDKAVAETAVSVNALEGYILAMLSKFGPENRKKLLMTEEAAAKVYNTLREEEERMAEEEAAGPEDKPKVDAKLKELKKLCGDL